MVRKLSLMVATALFGLLTVAPAAVAAPPQRHGGVVVVRGGFYGGGFWGPGYWGWGPGFYGYYGAPYGPYAGQVKIVSNDKAALVYVDGGLAGPVAKFKHFSLRPGNHNIQLRDQTGRIMYQEKVQIIAGKTAEIHANFQG